MTFVQSLRAMVDFLEAHPGVKQPTYLTVNVFVDDRAEIAEQARLCSWEKLHAQDWFALRRTFGEVSYYINISRDQICRRVVTGTRIEPAKPAQEVEVVEWICEDVSLLSEREEVAS